MANLFISYSRKDIDAARKLTDAFKGQDLDFWIDWEGIEPTVDWWLAIEKGIEEADTFVFLLSPDSVYSRVCGWEIEHAVKNGKRLIPIVVRDIKAEECPAQLRPLNWIYLRKGDDFEPAFGKLIKAIHTDYAWVQVHRQLQVKALEWETNKRKNEFLLRGEELRDAELQLATNSEKAPRPTELQREYVLLSRQASDRQRRLARGISVAVIISLGMLAAIAFVQAGIARTAEATAVVNASIAETERANAILEANGRATAQVNAEANEKLAEERAEIARSGELAAQSLALRDSNFSIALLLGLEAFDIVPTSQTRSILMDNTYAHPELLAYLSEYISLVESIAFSPDGKTLAAAYQNGVIVLWDMKTRRPMGPPLQGHSGFVYSVTFSPDGQTIASGSCAESNEGQGCNQGEIILWNMQTASPIGEPLRGHDGKVYSIAFHPDGNILASGSGDGTILLWDIETNEPIGEPLREHDEGVNSVSFSPDGKRLASGSADDTIILWDISKIFTAASETTQPVGQPMRGHSDNVFSVAFSPDGKTVASGSIDQTIVLWDVETMQPIGEPLSGHTGQVYSVIFSPDGKMLASASFDQTVILWDTNTKKPIGEPLHGHAAKVTSVAFHPDGNTLASGGADNAVILWDVSIRRNKGGGTMPAAAQASNKHTSFVYSIAFSPDGKTLASGSGDNTIILWEISMGNNLSMPTVKPIGKPWSGHSDWVRSVVFSPDGNLLASGSDDRTIILWNVKTGKPLRPPLTGHTDFVHSVAFSPDGKTLASGSIDGTIILWDVETWERLGQPLNAQGGAVYSVAFSPDSSILASGHEDTSIRVWDVTTRLPIGQPLRQHNGAVYTVAFSPDGQLLASASSDSAIVLWNLREDVKTGRPSIPYLGAHTDPVVSIAFSADGQRLASNSQDTTTIVWDINTRRPIGQPLRSTTSYLYSVAFSPSGGSILLASGSGDGTIVLWNMDPSSWIKDTCQRVGRNMTLGEWVQYFPDEPHHATCSEWSLES
jgi:WD40 repeat protein